MPPKKNATSTPRRGAAKATAANNSNRVKCDLCLAAIVEDKEDALQCEGTCQLWFHRYCAGVSQSLFKSLAGDDKPFICLHCSQESHHATVNELQSEVAALRAEVVELRAALEAIRSNADNSNAIASLMEEVEQLKAQPSRGKQAGTAQLWSHVVRKGKGKGRESGVNPMVRQLSLLKIQIVAPAMYLVPLGNVFLWKTAERSGVL